jgi:hypothetical protein
MRTNAAKEKMMNQPRQTPILISVFLAVLSLALFGLTACDTSPNILELVGARNESITQNYFEKGVADCHGAQYTDAQGRTWEGIPLWLLVGRVDNDVKHKGGYDDALADKGYQIEVFNADNLSVKFSSQEVKRNNNIIVANKMNGAALPAGTAPLALVGSGIDASRWLENVISIKLTF